MIRRSGGFGLFPVRSPLLGESRLISSPRATKMVQFARFPPGGVDPPPGARGFPRAGCPIRTSPDQRLPAAPRGVSPPSRVLHRPDTPRHSPCALASFHRAYPSLAARGYSFLAPRSRRAFAIALRLVTYVDSASPDVESRHLREEESDRQNLPGRRRGSNERTWQTTPTAGSPWLSARHAAISRTFPYGYRATASSRWSASTLDGFPRAPGAPHQGRARDTIPAPLLREDTSATGAVRSPSSSGGNTPDVACELCGARERIHRRVLTGGY
jgi:hypothetical protein